jgi:hypothetical protein
MIYLLYVAKSILFLIVAYTIIQLTPSFKKFLEKEDRVYIQNSNVEEDRTKEIEEEEKQTVNAEEKMERLFVNPDLNLNIKKNFDSVGTQMVKNYDSK